MEFNPANHVIQRCLQGLAEEENGNQEKAVEAYNKAWNEATNDFEKYLASNFVARVQENFSDQLKWLEISLHYAEKINDVIVISAYSSIYSKIAKCYSGIGDDANAEKYLELANLYRGNPADDGPFYHGTKADLKPGDLLTPGGNSNYKADLKMNHIYFTANINGAGLAASLANGDGPERVYIGEPTGNFQDDPNVTDKKFPGNPTRSYRSDAPLKIIGEITEWNRLTPQEIQKWKEKLTNNKGEIIN
jgi:rifampin ADP-ribosylating transferase